MSVDEPRPARPGAWKTPKRLTLAVSMILIAALAVGFAALADARRVRVVVHNDSDRVIRSVVVVNEGRETRFGPISAHSRGEVRVRSDLTEALRVSFEVAGLGREHGRRVEAPGVTPEGPGATVQIRYSGN